jgi:D-arabinose 1-dehydrogenase-like Zn-dependent alcohol dehydrogenase
MFISTDGEFAECSTVVGESPLLLVILQIMKDLVFTGSHIGGPKEIKEMLQLAADKVRGCEFNPTGGESQLSL